jgi:adenylosuccinate lyase
VWESDGEQSLLELLKQDPAVTDRIAPAELEKLFDLDHHLRAVDTLFGRVFGSHG